MGAGEEEVNVKMNLISISIAPTASIIQQRYYDLPVLSVIPLADQAGTGYGHKSRGQGAEDSRGQG